MIDPAMSPEIRAIFETNSPEVKDVLLELRALVFQTWAETGIDCALDESLKWGQPAYRPSRPRTGTTLRLGTVDGEAAIFVHCQTTIIAEMTDVFPEKCRFLGNRALVVGNDGTTPEELAKALISRTLTYHVP
jgi:hypothetical protein